MFSRFEGWDLENIRIWQGEENKSKKQRKCQSSFRLENWPSFVHINVMKLSLSVRSPEKGEKSGRRWRADGGAASPGCSQRWEQWLPTPSKAPEELCQHRHVLKPKPFELKKKIHVCHASMWEEIRAKGNQTKGCESSWREVSPASDLKKTYGRNRSIPGSPSELALNQKQPKCPSSVEQMHKLWCSHKMKYSSATTVNALPLHSTRGMTLTNIILRQRPRTQSTVRCPMLCDFNTR